MAKINMKINDEDLQDNGRKGFEPGTYHFEITRTELAAKVIGDSGEFRWVEGDALEDVDPKRIGTEKIRLGFVARLHPDSSISFKVFDDLWLTEGAKWRYVQFLKALGMDPAAELDTEEIDGKEGAFYLNFKKKRNRQEGEPEREAYLTPARFLSTEERDQWVKELPPIVGEPDSDEVPF